MKQRKRHYLNMATLVLAFLMGMPTTTKAQDGKYIA